MDDRAATRPSELGGVEPRSAARHGPDLGVAGLRAWTQATCYFRWRLAPFAQGQMHAELLRPDSIAAPAHDEAAQVIAERIEMPEVSIVCAEAALVFEDASAWACKAQPQGRDCSYFHRAFETCRALRHLSLNRDIIPADCADLSAYKLVLAPGVFAAQSARHDGYRRPRRNPVAKPDRGFNKQPSLPALARED